MGKATQPKTARNNKVYELHLKGWSNVEIGKKFDITRERVRQILLKKLSTGNGIDNR